MSMNNRAPAPTDLDDFVSALMHLPGIVRSYIACALLDSLTEEDDQAEEAIYEEAHRRSLEILRGEAEEIDGDEVIASLRTRERPEAGVDGAWAAEAHRRWEAHLRGEEMLDFDQVIADLKAGFRPIDSGDPPEIRITPAPEKDWPHTESAELAEEKLC